MNNKGTR